MTWCPWQYEESIETKTEDTEVGSELEERTSGKKPSFMVWQDWGINAIEEVNGGKINGNGEIALQGIQLSHQYVSVEGKRAL